MWSPSLTNPKKYSSWPQDKNVRRGKVYYIRFLCKGGCFYYRHRLKRDNVFAIARKEMLKNKMVKSFTVWYSGDFLTWEGANESV